MGTERAVSGDAMASGAWLEASETPSADFFNSLGGYANRTQ